MHCRVCVPLKEYVNEEYTVGFPSTERKYVHFPGAELVSSVTGGTTTYTTSYQGRVSRSTYTRTPHVDGAVVKFTQKYSGRRRCPHCMKKTKKKDGVKRFTLDEMEGLNRLAREWKADAGRMRGGWQEGRKLRSFREGETGLDLKREQATAFYQGKWFTEGMRKMHFSVTGQKKIKADTSKFERWKADHKCRMVAEDAIDIPAEKEAWTGLFELYLMMGNSPSENRFASRQVFHAAFRGVRGEVSVFSPGGEFLAIAAEPELVLEPDRQVKTQAVGKVELWFRVRGAEPGRLRVTVLAARSGGKTVPFF